MSEVKLTPMHDEPFKLGNRLVTFNTVEVIYSEEEIAEQKRKEEIEEARIKETFDSMNSALDRLNALLGGINKVAKDATESIEDLNKVCERCKGTNRVWDNGDKTHCHEG